MINTHIEASQNLLANCSIETTPNVYAKYGKFSDLVDKKSNNSKFRIYHLII